MNCDRVKTLLPLLLTGDVEAPTAASLRDHLAACAECQREHSGIHKIFKLLDRIPTPEVTVDLGLLYREAARERIRPSRRWSRTALAVLGVAATILLVLASWRCEIVWDSNQVVLRWGTPVPRPTVPPLAPSPVEEVSTASTETQYRLQLLGDALLATAADGERRDEQRRQDIASLKGQVQDLQRHLDQMRATVARDVTALYHAQFPETKKGDPQ